MVIRQGHLQEPLEVRSPGIGGLNLYDNPANLNDSQLIEAKNCFYNGGILTPRPGSRIFAEKPSRFEVETPTEEDSVFFYNTNNSQSPVQNPDEWTAQTFTVGEKNFTVNKIAFMMRRETGGTPGDVTVSLRETDEDGFPTSSDIISKTFPGSELPESYEPNGGFEVSIPNTFLNANTKYAIVVRASAPSSSPNRIVFRQRFGGSTPYPDGEKVISFDAGNNWELPFTETDISFEVFGTVELESLTTEHSIDEDPLQLIIPRTSDGVTVKMAIYENLFYIYHPDNEEWVRINIAGTYVPEETHLEYGWVNWNNGRGDDRVYGCNGVDNFWKWHWGVTQVKGDQDIGALILECEDITRFPDSGKIVVRNKAGELFTIDYTSKSGVHTLNLVGNLTNGVEDGASVVMALEEKPDMELGKIVQKHQQRLFVSNYLGGETVIWYSKQGDPENFTTGSAIPDASTAVIADGYGEITGIHDFGQFLVIEKEDSIHRFEIILDEGLNSKLDKIQPVLSGQSLGPTGFFKTVKVHNTLLYPTRSEGFLSLYPAGTGDNLSVQQQYISRNIEPLVFHEINLDNAQGVAFDQKVIWAVAERGGEQNIITLMYDVQREAWSIWRNWAVKSWGYDNGELFYLDNATGQIIQVFTGEFNDKNNPYEVIATTKRFDFGRMGKVKTQDLVYVQGLMVPATEFFIDVQYNEEGTLRTQTFRINKDTENLFISQPISNALGQFIKGRLPLGWVYLEEIGNLSFFRCYLPLNVGDGWYNMSVSFRSNKQTFWAITGLSFFPEEESVIPSQYILKEPEQ